MSETLKDSMDELMDYAKGNTETVEIRIYKIKKVPSYGGGPLGEADRYDWGECVGREVL